jgi:hypothetical protein
MGSIGSGSVSTIPSPNSSPSSFTTAPSNPNESPHGTLSRHLVIIITKVSHNNYCHLQIGDRKSPTSCWRRSDPTSAPSARSSMYVQSLLARNGGDKYLLSWFCLLSL